METNPPEGSFAQTVRQDPWGAFGLLPGASRQEIDAAFRRLVRAYHPDRSSAFFADTNTEVLRAVYDARQRLRGACNR